MAFEHRTEMIEEKPTIQMVPFCMREENKEISDDYEPKVVSLGPYHHGNEKLKFVEAFKDKAVEMFIERSRDGLNVFMAAILEEIGYARSSYLEEFTSRYTDEEFARMMLRDACFILNYFGPTKEFEESIKRGRTIGYLGPVVYATIERDMYLVENQVPFRILKMLVSLRYDLDHGQRLVQHMETKCFKMFFHDAHNEEPNDTNSLGREPLHLLEIFRRVVATGLDHETTSPADRCSCDINDLIGCLDFCCCRRFVRRSHEVFPSVTDLKLKGIHCSASGIKSLKGVRFSPVTGFFQSADLKLPSCHVTMYTRVFFKNMLAFEFSPYFSMAKVVTAYVSFMKLLVASKEDVKELREQEVIINHLGSDEQVAQLYNALHTYEAFDKDPSYFWDIRVAILRHIKTKTNPTMAELGAELRTNYFNNHWSIVVFAASIFVICLDFIQTYYTIHPNAPADKS